MTTTFRSIRAAAQRASTIAPDEPQARKVADARIQVIQPTAGDFASDGNGRAARSAQAELVVRGLAIAQAVEPTADLQPYAGRFAGRQTPQKDERQREEDARKQFHTLRASRVLPCEQHAAARAQVLPRARIRRAAEGPIAL